MAHPPPSMELIAACMLPNDRGLSKARRLLNAGVAVEPMDSRGTTPLVAAAMSNSVRTCELLLKKGAEIDRAVPGFQGTALHGACAAGHRGVVELLLGRGARVDAAMSDGGQPLRGAAEGGHIEVARLLLARGADPCHAKSDGDTALHAACRRGHLAMAELLVQSAGPRIVDITNGEGDTALHAAVGHVQVMQLLLSKGADPNHVVNGCTALHVAAYKGFAVAARLLLLSGAHVDPLTFHGLTPLAAAANLKHSQVRVGRCGGWLTGRSVLPSAEFRDATVRKGIPRDVQL